MKKTLSITITMIIMMYLVSFAKQENHNLDLKGKVVAIPASEKNVNALIAESFSRSPSFCLYNTETGSISFIENPHKDASGGASRQVIQLLANKEVKEVYAVKVGQNAEKQLYRFRITLKPVKAGQTVQEVIISIKK